MFLLLLLQATLISARLGSPIEETQQQLSDTQADTLTSTERHAYATAKIGSTYKKDRFGIAEQIVQTGVASVPIKHWVPLVGQEIYDPPKTSTSKKCNNCETSTIHKKAIIVDTIPIVPHETNNPSVPSSPIVSNPDSPLLSKNMNNYPVTDQALEDLIRS